MRTHRLRRTIPPLAVALLLGIAACSSDDDGSGGAGGSSNTSSTTTTAVPAELTGVIAIGHSGMTGVNSDPSWGTDRSAADRSWPEHSWATGETPEVASIYQRLVAIEPRHEGHVTNRSRNGDRVEELVGQANQALDEVPNPALVLVQVIDNDIRCDGTDGENVAAIGESFTEVLDVITDAAPDATIVIAGSQNRPRTFVDALIAKGETLLPDGSICQLFQGDGTPDDAGIATLTEIIEDYEAEMDRVCATYERCTSLIAEAAAAPIGPDSIAGDLGHASIQGHQELAEALWPGVQQAMGL